jgi:serine/threonine protein kinase
MLTQDSDVRIIDFGIALVADSEISRIEGIAGSPSYMSPEQVQSLELTHHSDLYSLGAVMYELLTGIRPFRAGNLVKLLHQIVYATPPPIHTQRKDVPEDLEEIVVTAMQKTPDKRHKSGADFAAELTRVHQRLREQNARIDQQAQFDVLRRLRFFHEFSHAEIWEVLRASTMTDYPAGEEIVKEGEMDDRFYILVNGSCTVERHGKKLGAMESGDCFGETSYVRGARRTATIRAESAVSVLRVSSTLLEQVSAACQLRFNRVFLKALVSRLQGNDQPVE